jgi:site-specific recombinase XerD
VKTYAEKAGISWAEDVSPHTLRHTFATRLLGRTGNIRLVQKALGHSDLSTTMIYTHIVDEELELAMKGG